MVNVGLESGLRALLTSQFALDTIGHNIANANTPGYSRQRVDLESLRPIMARGILIGGGVGANDVRRSVDGLLQKRILTQVATNGRLGFQLGSLEELEAVFGEPANGGFSTLLNGFFESFSALSAAPEDTVLRTGAVQSALSMTTQLHTLSESLSTLRMEAAAQLQTRMSEVNAITAGIAELNIDIGATEAAVVSANDLRDQRDELLKRLAELVDVTTIEAPNGAVSVLVAGNMLVSPTKAYKLSGTSDAAGALQIEIASAVGPIAVKGGAIGGILRLSEELAPVYGQQLDALARSLALELNRAHSTGIPASGAFQQLRSDYAVQDQDLDGNLEDELLANAGLPFDVTSGELFVTMSDAETGAVAKHKIAIDASTTTVGDFLTALNAIPQLSAGLDGFGRVVLVADPGQRFDFSPRLDAAPDAVGSFGGDAATLSTASGPFALADGDTLDLDVLPGPSTLSIAFAAADFQTIGAATAEEIAAVVNADAGAQAAGIKATSVAGRLVLQTQGTGTAAGFTINGGAAVAALGWTAQVGTPVTGHDGAASVTVTGSYGGATNQALTFVAVGEGTIGTTPGLMVEVRGANGELVTALDVGAGYQPGTPLEIGDGVSVSFGLGDLSGASNDFFALDLVADADTADVLVAFGLNSLLTGTTAAKLDVRADLVLDPSLLAASHTGAEGDNGALLAILDVQNAAVESLGGDSLGAGYGKLVSGLGFEAQSTRSALTAGDSLLTSLELRRASLSGVNMDEELVDLMRFEQAFQAASQYITTLNQLNQELLDIL